MEETHKQNTNFLAQNFVVNMLKLPKSAGKVPWI